MKQVENVRTMCARSSTRLVKPDRYGDRGATSSPFTSLQIQQFHAITHAFAQQQSYISSIFIQAGSGGRHDYDPRSRAARTEALWWAMASMEIMGFTPEALGNAEPSMTYRLRTSHV